VEIKIFDSGGCGEQSWWGKNIPEFRDIGKSICCRGSNKRVDMLGGADLTFGV